MRAHLNKLVQDAAGNLLTDITISIYEPGTTTLLSEQLYSDDSGTTLTNPFTSSDGVIDIYLNLPRRVKVGAQATGFDENFYDDLDVIVPIVPEEQATVNTITAPSGAVVLDVAAHRVHKIIMSGADEITSMTVEGAFDGAMLTVLVSADADQTLTWATDMRPDDAAVTLPDTPAVGKWLCVRFVYEATSLIWIEQSRSIVTV